MHRDEIRQYATRKMERASERASGRVELFASPVCMAAQVGFFVTILKNTQETSHKDQSYKKS